MLRARWLEVHGRNIMGSPPGDAVDAPIAVPMSGLAIEVRGVARPLFFGWVLTGQLLADERNPEDVRPIGLIGTGPTAGFTADPWSRVSVSLGARVEWVNAWNWPDGEWPRTRDVHDGVRGGPAASAAFWLGRIFGHPFGLGIEIDRLYHRVGQTRGLGWGGALVLTGQLRPQPEDYGVYDWTPSWARPD